MKWLLIYLVVDSWGVAMTTHGLYDSMEKCFVAREQLKAVVADDYKEQFPSGQQAVCVSTSK